MHVGSEGDKEKGETKEMERWSERFFEILGPEHTGGCEACMG